MTSPAAKAVPADVRFLKCECVAADGGVELGACLLYLPDREGIWCGGRNICSAVRPGLDRCRTVSYQGTERFSVPAGYVLSIFHSCWPGDAVLLFVFISGTGSAGSGYCPAAFLPGLRVHRYLYHDH